MPWMYILECADGSYYVGSTVDLERRLEQHQKDIGAVYTSKRLPVRLAYFEGYELISEAYHREKRVQRWSRTKREALNEGNLELLPGLAKKDFNKRKMKE